MSSAGSPLNPLGRLFSEGARNAKTRAALVWGDKRSQGERLHLEALCLFKLVQVALDLLTHPHTRGEPTTPQ